jgi:predicted outer membrane repeat protein
MRVGFRGALLGAVATGLSSTVFATAPALAASTVYVSSIGSDTNSCATLAAACASLTQALSDLGSGGGTIQVEGTIPELTVGGGADRAGVEISGTVTIEAVPEQAAVLDASGVPNSLLTVGSSSTLTVSGVTIEDATPSADGGAINNAGTLSVTNAGFPDDKLPLTNDEYSGGAIASTGSVTIAGSSFTDDTAPGGWGGALYSHGGGNVTISGSTFSGGSSLGGGAIEFEGSGSLSVVGSTFDDNSSLNSGGAIESPGHVTVSDSTFSGNSSNGGGSTIDSNTTLLISDSTFSDNPAQDEYAVVDPANGTADVVGSTFIGNASQGAFYLATSSAQISVAGDVFDGSCYVDSTWGDAMVDDGYNLATNPSCLGGSYASTDSLWDGTAIGSLENNKGSDGTSTPETAALTTGNSGIGLIPAGTVVSAGSVNWTCGSDQDELGDVTPAGIACDAGSLQSESAAGPGSAASAYIATAYVSPSGHDGDTCASAAQACASLARALQVLGPAGGTLVITGTINESNADGTVDTRGLTVHGSLTVESAPGDTGVIDGTGGFDGEFIVPTGSSLELSNITVQNSTASDFPVIEDGGVAFVQGGLTVTNATLDDDNAGEAGGAIECDQCSSLSVSDSTFDGDTVQARSGGAIDGTDSGAIDITASVFKEDSAYGGGGAIASGNQLTVSDSTFEDDSTTQWGGAIDADGSSTISDSTFDGDRGGDGGALDTEGPAAVVDSTFSGNSAQAGGGSDQGGAIYDSGHMSILASTLVGNTANTGSDVSIGAGLSVAGDVLADGCDKPSAVTDDGYNVATSASCLGGTFGSSDAPWDGGEIGGLANNQGFSLGAADSPETVALWAENPGRGLVPAGTTLAIGGSSWTCGSSTDELGDIQPTGDACDSGALQQPAPLPQIIAFGSANPTPADVGSTYTPSASGGDSGQLVVIAIDTSETTNGACSWASTSGVISFQHEGTCVLEATQAGTDAYKSGKAEQVITVVAPSSGTTSTGTTTTGTGAGSSGSGAMPTNSATTAPTLRTAKVQPHVRILGVKNHRTYRHVPSGVRCAATAAGTKVVSCKLTRRIVKRRTRETVTYTAVAIAANGSRSTTKVMIQVVL